MNLVRTRLAGNIPSNCFGNGTVVGFERPIFITIKQ